MGIAFGTTPEAELLAKIVTSLTANGTLSTSDANFQGNSVADLESFDLRPYGHDLTSGLMSK